MAIFTRQATEGEKKWYQKNATLWESDVTKFDYPYENDETVIVFKGVAEVTCGTQTVRLEPGMLAYFPKGTMGVWNVIQPISKYLR